MNIVAHLESLRYSNCSLLISDRKLIAETISCINFDSYCESEKPLSNAELRDLASSRSKIVKRLESLSYNTPDLSIYDRMVISRAIEMMRASRDYFIDQERLSSSARILPMAV